MRYDFPGEIRTLLEGRMATGKYASEDDVLRRALRALTDYDQAIADIQQGMDDEAAGRLRPLNAVDSEIRHKLGFTG